MICEQLSKQNEKGIQLTKNAPKMVILTEVCHFGHFWLSYGRSATSGSPMGRSKGAP